MASVLDCGLITYLDICAMGMPGVAAAITIGEVAGGLDLLLLLPLCLSSAPR